ncbi:MAG: hypothetical protein EWV60_02480 [Microcystis sp. Msp_OC_L_20101000_S702]|nr:MAG: hypothetical protein EWV60_02480 [Microcystis sp. Msp_OC_L_20101000_S702]
MVSEFIQLLAPIMLCDNFCLWNREMLTEKDFYDYFAEETISIGFVSTQKPEEPIFQPISKRAFSVH